MELEKASEISSSVVSSFIILLFFAGFQAHVKDKWPYYIK